MQPRRHQSLDLVEIDDDYNNTRYKLDGPVGEEDFNTTRPTCYNTSKRSERCATVGDIRVDGNHSLIYAIPLAREWRTKRYALRHDPVAMDDVREFTLHPFGGVDNPPPLCTQNHSVPGFLFSNGSFTGNLYHNYTDVLMPLFTSTHHFGGEVQFMVSDIKDWWVDKFTPLFRQLSRYDIIDVNNDWEMHCFPCIFIGSTFHTMPWASSPCDHRAGSPSPTSSASSVAPSASTVPSPHRERPRLLIISCKSSRHFLNQRAMAHAAQMPVQRILIRLLINGQNSNSVD
jgi:hypothetical protein